MQTRSWRRRILAAIVGIAVALALAEGALRLLAGPIRPVGELYFRDAAGERVGMLGAWQEAHKRGLVELLPADQTPRPRARFAPGAQFFMCYEDSARLAADWLDDRGCVEVRINRFGLRERDEITPDNKQSDERRVVCVGDSFTFGWGIPVEQCWVRRLEQDLRRTNGNVRTVNCGLSGALTVDEYWWGLRTRFGAFAPDVVVVSIYMNDLVPSDGLCILGPRSEPSGSLLWDRLRAAVQRSPLELDPAVDWVPVLLGIPEEQGTQAGWYGPDKPFAGMWSQGAPQAAIAAMNDWCRDHNSNFLIVLWPFLQGLGPGSSYPFRGLHERVRAYCGDQGIAVLDLEPVLSVEPAERLWVSPADMHANLRAQELATPAIAAFVRSHWPP